MNFLTNKDIDEAYERFLFLQSGEGSFKYNQKDAFRASLKKIDCDKAFLNKTQEDTKFICKRIKENPPGFWNWMRRSKNG